MISITFVLLFRARLFPQDFGNMTHTHGIGNFSDVLLKIGEKMHDFIFAVIK
jgi:hypothetical protein